MIRLYCRKVHKHIPKEKDSALCCDCNELLAYASLRLQRCRYGAMKPTCKNCPTHCYKSDMREKIRAVMRWAGPRMMFYHPALALKHLLKK